METIFEEIKDLVYRWEKHKNFLKIVKNSNINNDVYNEWKNLIDNSFIYKIKSKL
jgi:hypothetical protein